MAALCNRADHYI